MSEIQVCTNLILRALQGFIPRIVDDNGETIPDHPYTWICDSPDKQVPWGVWMSRFMQCSLIFDAAALVMRADDNGKLDSINYIDGSTLFVWVDEFGRMPAPKPIKDRDGRVIYNKDTGLPEIPNAFTQVIKGTPFAWYNQNQIYYRPFTRRYNAPYGVSPIEVAWNWILVIANITAFELAHYRTCPVLHLRHHG